jgi:hypothetical protein
MTTKTPAVMTDGLLRSANNLSDVNSVSASRAALQLGSNFVTAADGRAIMLELADLKGVALNFLQGQADAFDSDTIGATSTDETYDATNDWYTSNTGGGVTDMTLINPGLTASSDPSEVRITVQAQFVDAATVNTDLTAEVSRDGGTTWTAVTLGVGATTGDFTLYEGTGDVSAQPSGTSVQYRVKTLNSKDIRVSGVVVRWS